MSASIVDIPGCVEAHEVDEDNIILTEDDPKGTKTFCDADVPSFNPIDFSTHKRFITSTRRRPGDGGD